MTDYQRVILSGPTIDGEPGLPATLVGLAVESLADLSAAIDPCPQEYVGIGYWPIQPADPAPEGKIAVGREPEFVEGVLKWVEDLEDARPPPFPDLTRRQLRLGLMSVGITQEHVNAQIALIEDAEERAYSMIEWEDASAFERHHPLVDGIAGEMALPPGNVDALWRWAAGL